MLLDDERRETLTEAALQSHSTLRGLSQQLAEVYYIMEAQQLQGYGQEHFVCRVSQGGARVSQGGSRVSQGGARVSQGGARVSQGGAAARGIRPG